MGEMYTFSPFREGKLHFLIGGICDMHHKLRGWTPLWIIIIVIVIVVVVIVVIISSSSISINIIIAILNYHWSWISLTLCIFLCIAY